MPSPSKNYVLSLQEDSNISTSLIIFSFIFPLSLLIFLLYILHFHFLSVSFRSYFVILIFNGYFFFYSRLFFIYIFYSVDIPYSGGGYFLEFTPLEHLVAPRIKLKGQCHEIFRRPIINQKSIFPVPN